MNQYSALKEIEARMSATLSRAVGVSVEVNARHAGHWTISGQPAHVSAAVAYVTGHSVMILQGEVLDDELGEAFAYLADGPAM